MIACSPRTIFVEADTNHKILLFNNVTWHAWKNKNLITDYALHEVEILRCKENHKPNSSKHYDRWYLLLLGIYRSASISIYRLS